MPSAAFGYSIRQVPREKPDARDAAREASTSIAGKLLRGASKSRS